MNANTACVLIITLILYIPYLRLIVYPHRSASTSKRLYEQAKERGHVVMAREVRRKRIRGHLGADDSALRNDRIMCTYEYIVNAKKHKIVILLTEGHQGWSSSPKELTFYYDHRNPNRVFVEEDVGNAKEGLLGLSAYIPALIFGGLIGLFLIVAIVYRFLIIR